MVEPEGEKISKFCLLLIAGKCIFQSALRCLATVTQKTTIKNEKGFSNENITPDNEFGQNHRS